MLAVNFRMNLISNHNFVLILIIFRPKWLLSVILGIKVANQYKIWPKIANFYTIQVHRKLSP